MSRQPPTIPAPEELAARILELDKVLALVAEEALTTPARNRLRALKPVTAEAGPAAPQLSAELKRTAAFKDLIAEVGPVTLSGIEDLSPFLEEIRLRESWLAPRELLQIADTFAALMEIYNFRNRAAETRPHLFEPLALIFAEIKTFTPLLKLIESCIDNEEEIRDSASFELKDIRQRISSSRQRIHADLNQVLNNPEMEPYIQESLITIRNQRYVVPLKTNFRGAIDGIIHDHSRSRQTFFVEPLNSVALNNNLALLLQEEKQEEIAILKMIADRLREATADINATLTKVFALDTLQAKARFALRIKACAPSLLEDWAGCGFILKEARHPLLAAAGPAAVVAIDIEFPAGRCGLVISGANTGGKTVSLKTAGLIALMARCGLLLPVAESSRVPIFAKVLATIGDEQNLAASLSTFSGHLLAVKAILEVADKRSLVLLDELGVGTDPKEGAALAQAILMELKERRSIFLATTHYNDVKAYAYEEEGISSVAVAFDPKTFRPLYHLQYGVPGLSNALVIARNLGFSAELIERARGLQNEAEVRTTTLASRLEKRLANTANHETELLKLKQEARIEKERAARLTAELEQEKEKVKTGAREQIGEIVNKARLKFKTRLQELEKSKSELDRARRQLAEKAAAGAELPEGHNLPEIKVGKLRGSFNEAAAAVARLTPPPQTTPAAIDFSKIKPGDRVVVAGQAQAAAVIACEKAGRSFTVLIDGNLRVKLNADKIERHLPQDAKENRRKPAPAVRIRNIPAVEEIDDKGRCQQPEAAAADSGRGFSGATLVLNLVGKRVEEALELMIPFIDQAVVGGQEQVELIHGHGTGRLRQGLHEALKTLPYVSDFHHPDSAAGGAAITIVKLIKK